jgi:undecaprenyl phosphate N,N'-diacetylbacillosamine 1-phosphate transferase
MVTQNGIYRRFIKRPMDFILSLIAILVLSPVFLIVAILVRFKLGSPVLFKQKRPGLHEKIFMMYKFRTMTDEKNRNGELLPDQIRLTRFGKILRSTSLDELPGLFNILKGDMSIVGPRPLLVRYLPFYTEEEKKRHSVRPGLTGLSQINGRNLLEWNKRLKLDVQYAESVSFLQDIDIIFRTLKKVIQRRDIVAGDQHVLKSLDIERRTIKNENI